MVHNDLIWGYFKIFKNVLNNYLILKFLHRIYSIKKYPNNFLEYKYSSKDKSCIKCVNF